MLFPVEDAPGLRRIVFATSMGTVFLACGCILSGFLPRDISVQLFTGLNETAAYIFVKHAFAVGFAQFLAFFILCITCRLVRAESLAVRRWQVPVRIPNFLLAFCICETRHHPFNPDFFQGERHVRQQ